MTLGADATSAGSAASPPVFEQIFRNARFAQGGNAVFEGRVRGNPLPQVIWTRKGMQMKGQSSGASPYERSALPYVKQPEYS